MNVPVPQSKANWRELYRAAILELAPLNFRIESLTQRAYLLHEPGNCSKRVAIAEKSPKIWTMPGTHPTPFVAF